MTNELKMGTKEDFLPFFGDPSKDKLREIIKHHSGETRYLEFKASWPAFEKISKSILSIANAGYGLIIIGISEESDGSSNPVGIENFEDKAKIFDALSKYLPPTLLENVSIYDFHYDGSEYAKLNGKKFQVIKIQGLAVARPYISLKAGTGISKDRIYVRRDGMSYSPSVGQFLA